MKGLKYERYILFILVLPTKFFPFTIHVFEFIFPKKWSLKYYLITKFFFFF